MFLHFRDLRDSSCTVLIRVRSLMLRRIFLLSCSIEVGCNVPFKILTVRDEYDVCGGNVFQSSITVFVIRVTSFVTIMEMKSLMVSTRAILSSAVKLSLRCF